MAEATSAANAVQIRLRCLREIKVDHDVNRLNIDTTCEQVSGHEAARLTVLTVMVDTVTIALLHLRMNVETRVTKLGDLLCKKLNSLGRIAENNSLIDV